MCTVISITIRLTIIAIPFWSNTVQCNEVCSSVHFKSKLKKVIQMYFSIQGTAISTIKPVSAIPCSVQFSLFQQSPIVNCKEATNMIIPFKKLQSVPSSQSVLYNAVCSSVCSNSLLLSIVKRQQI